MCGIAGFVSAKINPDALGPMLSAIIHRGPDAEGRFHDGPFVAGMRRLSINDLEHGDQPLMNEDGSVILFYNGEIYNSPELRRGLENRGHRLRSHSDGEVIVHLYEELGLDLFEALDGMFAAALWDTSRQRLILARDLPGEKPLYYSVLGDGSLAFASEIKSLARCPGLNLDLDLQALWDFPSFLWIPEPDTVYDGIKALPRGHLLIAEAGQCTLRSYANRFNLDPIADTDEATVAETRRVVETAVQSRLLADVPVGTFLSSGLDSSIVTAIAARHTTDLSTFSIGFEDVEDPYHGRSDESADAADFARRLGVRHTTIRVTGDDIRGELETFCRHGDQPFAVSSGLGILLVAKEARRQGVKVLLSGDGADEIFGGYSWYAHLSRLSEMSRSQTPHSGQPAHSMQDWRVDLETRLAAMARSDAAGQAWAWHYYASEAEKTRLFSHDLTAAAAPSSRFFQTFDPAARWSAQRFIEHDRGFYLPFEMMRKLDRMTMAYSVEGRAPFVAPPVLNHGNKLTLDRMIRGDTLKWSLRQAFADLLPDDVTNRPKHGFNVPIDHWLKGPWRELLRSTFAPSSALARLGFLGRDAETTAAEMAADPTRLNGHSLFCYIMLNLWLEHERHGNHR